MAKRTGAPARPGHPPSPRRYSYTPELLASGRHRYERTADSIPDIALDFGIHKTTLQRLARREGWVRFAPPPRDLPAAVKLAAQAEALAPPPLVPAQAGLQEHDRDAGGFGSGSRPSRGRADETASTEPDAARPPVAATVGRLHRAVLAELAAVERMRAVLDAEPQSPLAAERTSRTLSSLTATLHRIQRMQAGLPDTGPNDDDIPADLDALRDALARRIAAFMASRPDAGDAGEPAAAPADGA